MLQSFRMISVIIKAVLLLHLFQLIAGQSPCPNYFRYVQDEASDEIIGYIEIPSPPKGVNLQLSVKLSIAVALPSVNKFFIHICKYFLISLKNRDLTCEVF